MTWSQGAAALKLCKNGKCHHCNRARHHDIRLAACTSRTSLNIEDGLQCEVCDLDQIPWCESHSCATAYVSQRVHQQTVLNHQHTPPHNTLWVYDATWTSCRNSSEPSIRSLSASANTWQTFALCRSFSPWSCNRAFCNSKSICWACKDNSLCQFVYEAACMFVYRQQQSAEYWWSSSVYHRELQHTASKIQPS